MCSQLLISNPSFSLNILKYSRYSKKELFHIKYRGRTTHTQKYVCQSSLLEQSRTTDDIIKSILNRCTTVCTVHMYSNRNKESENVGLSLFPRDLRLSQRRGQSCQIVSADRTAFHQGVLLELPRSGKPVDLIPAPTGN